MPQSRYQLRDMCVADLASVLAIEKQAQISPWARLSFEESLSSHHHSRVIYDAQRLATIVAYHVVRPILDELHILNLVVSKEYQGQGISHILMHDIFSFVEREGTIKKVFLEVRKGNKKAQNLYQQWQFKQVAIRKQYYRSGPTKQREDALVFVRVV